MRLKSHWPIIFSIMIGLLIRKISCSVIKRKMYKLPIISLITKMYLTVLKSSKVSSESLHCFFSATATQHPDNPWASLKGIWSINTTVYNKTWNQRTIRKALFLNLNFFSRYKMGLSRFYLYPYSFP